VRGFSVRGFSARSPAAAHPTLGLAFDIYLNISFESREFNLHVSDTSSNPAAVFTSNDSAAATQQPTGYW
jgi:hypothetical protein